MAEALAADISTAPTHLGGITRVCFSPDGTTIFTGGSDCLVRIHRADDPDSEPGFHADHTDAITSLSCSKANLVTASLDNISRIFSYPANEFQGFLTRSSGVPIRWVSIDSSGERAAVCADDLLVKIVHINDTSRVSLLSDNTKSVRSASWDPSGKYLVTVSCDGKLRIYDMGGSTPVLLKIMEGVIASSESDSTVSCYAAWHPAGNYFAIPTRTNEIGIINREGWTKSHTYTTDGPKTAIGELAWSPNGKYLASAAGSQILVWSKDTRAVVSRHNNPEGAITGLAFSPRTNLIAFTSFDGSFSRWTSPIPASLPDPMTTEEVSAKKLDRLLDDDFGDDDEDMEDKGEDIDDFGAADDWIVDDDGAYADEDGEKTRGGRTEVVNVTKAQEPFAPGCTVFKNKKRYLAFNMIGVIDVTDQETHNVVNVEFHDKSARRGYHFQDHTKYTMASLGEQGVIYAASSQDGQPSSIYYRPYDSWASTADWTMNLLPNEEALCVAAGGASGDGMGSVVVATSKGFVRFLSSSGIQRYLWRIGEEAVSMAAGKDMVIIVHREGGTSLDGCQNLRYSLIDLESFELVQEGRIPLPRKVTLTWLGFTAEGSPAIYDSTGLLSVLDRFRRPGQARWVPILDSAMLARKQGRTETYWPVGLSSTAFTAVILKGNEKEPWFPRPLVQELEMHMPLLNTENQQGRLEESMVRNEIQLNLLQDNLAQTNDSDLELEIKTREIALDKELLQLVQGACKADNLQRALDITRLMHNPQTVDAAAKVAAFYHLPGLQERINAVKGDVELRRLKERRSKRTAGTGFSATGGGAGSKFGDFAPRGAARRNFAGRDSTPLNPRGESYVPETPHDESGTTRIAETPAPEEDEVYGREISPPVEKRKREEPIDDFAPKRRVDDFAPPNGNGTSSAGAAKNPFAKRPATQASNPFAKPAVAKPLDAIKSTSFFERVDDIESSGAPKTTKQRKKTDKPHGERGQNVPGGPKQTTLMGLKKPPASTARPQPHFQESFTSTETEGDDDENVRGNMEDETQTDDRDTYAGILEESHVQETAASPEPMDV